MLDDSGGRSGSLCIRVQWSRGVGVVPQEALFPEYGPGVSCTAGRVLRGRAGRRSRQDRDKCDTSDPAGCRARIRDSALCDFDE